MVAADVGFGVPDVSVVERRGLAAPGRAASGEQLPIRPVQRAGVHRRVPLAGGGDPLLGVARLRSRRVVRKTP